ncbi:MAG: hypothetical protein K2M34_01330 [Alphaproteobacteria bacterium]|nr:hypothetical protein [Alphaproteobacteria bacterium]
MNRLIIQEIEKFLSRSIVYIGKDTIDVTSLIAKDLVTNNRLYFERKYTFNSSTGKIADTEYRIAEDYDLYRKYFYHFSPSEAAQVFDIAYNRYTEYFEKPRRDCTQTEFYQMLLKNNHRIK